MSQERNLPEVFDLNEILGEHLFHKIKELFPIFDDSKVGQITGVFLECPKNEIFSMLEHAEVLERRINYVLNSLDGLKHDDLNCNEISNCGPTCKTETDDEVAERLFELVKTIEPDICSQITGMLLELDKTELKGIIICPTKLAEAVQKAKSAYIATVKMKDLNSEEIGEKIYDIVEDLYPENAEKISGMLLEMDSETLRTLIGDAAALKIKMDEAAKVLRDDVS